MLALIVASLLVGQPARWIETSHADFADGIIDPQMYVSLRAQLETDSGCVEFFSRFDVDNDGYYDLGCSDDSGPSLTLYLGSASGYSPGRRLRYGPLGSGGNIDLADLNLDGYAELIHSGWRDGQAVIYWGTPLGPSESDTTVLDYDGEGEAVSVYDLDKDGYLDVLLGSSTGGLYIFWGSKDGYTTANHSVVDIGHAIGHNIEIADLDRDGWGDIVLSSWTWNENPIVYWGPNRQVRNTVWLPGRWNNSHGITVADLDRNGWLDIVYTGYDTVVTTLVYYGSPFGYSTGGRVEIHPGQCYGGSAAVDLNDDARLDLVFLRGNWIHGGTWKPCVYYNTGVWPYFSDASRADLGTGTFNASGGFIADFDRDDINDIFVNNMVNDDSSYILWGPDHMRRTALPTDMDHHGVYREPGNVYDRSLTAYYQSSVYFGGDSVRCVDGACRWLSHDPPGTKIFVALRSGDTPVPDSSWTEFAWVDSVTGRIPPQCLGGSYLQYQVVFRYLWPCFLPNLEEITFDLLNAPRLPIDVGVTEILAPPDSVDSGATVVPSAVVRNFGSVASNFNVQMRIGPDYTSRTFATLVPGEADTVTFAPWTPAWRGTWPVKCSTMLSIDHDRSNDARTKTVSIGVHDVGAMLVLAPIGTMYEGDSVVPRAVVRNFGSGYERFEVEFRIGSTYVDTAVVTDIAPGAEVDVTFRSYSAVLGRHVVTCSTMLSTDAVRANDRVEDSLDVITRPVHDVGVTAILAPVDSLDSGAVVKPRATVRNFGTRPALCPVRLHIGAGYADERTVSLSVGADDTVEFREWTAEPCGSHEVRCTTAYDLDSNPANDRLVDSTTVVPPAVYDVAVTAILAPVAAMDSGVPVTPCAVIVNLGNRPAVLPVRFYIGAAYSDEQAVLLAAGQVDTVAFRNWTAMPRGGLAVRCTAAYVLDQNPANDQQQVGVFVRVHDAAAVRVLAPTGTIGAGDTVSPAVLVANLGNMRETFMVLARIDAGFCETAHVNGLYPDSGVVVTFPVWQALTGLRTVVCSTMLAGDMDRSNDRAEDTVRVLPWSQQDVGVVQILAPAPVVDSGTDVLPAAVVGNFGSAPVNFAVRMTIGSLYQDERIVSLAPSAYDTVTFSGWRAAGRGTQTVRCSTMLAQDSNPVNDTLSRPARVRVRDVGAVRIVSPPGQVRTGEVVTPLVEVRNFGTEVEDFNAVFRIEGGYEDTVRVTGLAPGAWLDARFRTWPAMTGDYSISCSTCLSVDMQPGNDRVAGILYVVQRALIMVPDSSAWVYPAASVDYVLRVTNVSPDIDTVDILAVSSRANWQFELMDAAKANRLPDRNGNGIPDIAGLWPGATEPFTVRVTVPSDELALVRDSTLVTGRSSRDTTVTDQACLRTSVLPVASVSISPDAYDSIPSGGLKDYVLKVENLGNAPDLADLEVEHVSRQPGWYYELLTETGSALLDRNGNGRPDLGPLAPLAGTGRFLLRARAPTDARPGETDTVMVWSSSGSSPGVRSSILVRTKALGLLTGFEVAPDQQDQQLTGTSRSYRLYVRTRGNVTDIANLTAETQQPGWQVDLCTEDGATRLPDGNGDGRAELGPIAPGAEHGFSILVRAPDDIPDDLSGNIDSLGKCYINVVGRSTAFDGLGDTALVVVQAIPRLAIHNFRNPFRENTRFIFAVPQAGKASLRVYNRAGELVGRVFEQEEFGIGIFTRPWDGRNLAGRRLAPGTYLYTFELTQTVDGLDRRLAKKLMIE